MGLVADVFDVVILDSTNNPIASTTLQDANIEISMTANDVRAGKGNQLIAIIHSTRDINIPLTDVEWNYEYLAMQLGQDINTGAGVAYAMPKWYTAVAESSNVKITLDEAPKMTTGGTPAPVLLKIYKEDGTAVSGTHITVAAKVVTIAAAGGVEAGDKVEVRTYVYESSATTQKISIDDTVFPKDFKIVLETIEIDSDESPTHRLQYQFDRSKPTGNITLNTSSERNASTQVMNLRVLKPKTSTEVGRVLRIPISS